MPAPDPATPACSRWGPTSASASWSRGAGFSEIDIEEVALEWRFEDFDEYWLFLGEMAARSRW